MFDIRKDDLSGEASRQLLALHLHSMRANSPPEAVFALDLSGLTAPEVTVWSMWVGDSVVAIGALKELGDGAGEVKSMRTHPDHLRKGAAALLLNHIIGEARARIVAAEPGDGERPGFRACSRALPQARLRQR